MTKSSKFTRRQRRQLARSSKQFGMPHQDPQSPNPSSQKMLKIQQASLSIGPLPSPEILQQYEQMHPGTGERIVRRFELEGEHRHAIENKIVDAQIARDSADVAGFKRGQRFGLTVAISGLIIAAITMIISVYQKSETGIITGGSLGGVTLTSMVVAFLAGRKDKKPEPEKQS